MPGGEKKESLDSRVMTRTRGVQILIGRVRHRLEYQQQGVVEAQREIQGELLGER